MNGLPVEILEGLFKYISSLSRDLINSLIIILGPPAASAAE